MTTSRISGATVVSPLMTRDTLDLDTPARTATTWRVGRFMPLPSHFRCPGRFSGSVPSSGPTSGFVCWRCKQRIRGPGRTAVFRTCSLPAPASVAALSDSGGRQGALHQHSPLEISAFLKAYKAIDSPPSRPHAPFRERSLNFPHLRSRLCEPCCAASTHLSDSSSSRSPGTRKNPRAAPPAPWGTGLRMSGHVPLRRSCSIP